METKNETARSKVINILTREGEATAHEIAEDVGMHSSTVLKMLRILMLDGEAVTAESKDGRKLVWKLGSCLRRGEARQCDAILAALAGGATRGELAKRTGISGNVLCYSIDGLHERGEIFVSGWRKEGKRHVEVFAAGGGEDAPKPRARRAAVKRDEGGGFTQIRVTGSASRLPRIPTLAEMLGA